MALACKQTLLSHKFSDRAIQHIKQSQFSILMNKILQTTNDSLKYLKGWGWCLEFLFTTILDQYCTLYSKINLFLVVSHWQQRYSVQNSLTS